MHILLSRVYIEYFMHITRVVLEYGYYVLEYIRARIYII